MKESAFGSAIRLIEDALVLIKRADAGTWLIYVAGVVPFFGLLLFEVTDLAQNPFALQRLVSMAFGLAILYVWLHVCQSVYCGRLQAILTESDVSSPFAFAFAVQPMLAPSKLVLWPLALGVLIPHPVVTMFYQHSLVPNGAQAGATMAHSALAEAKRDAGYRRAEAVWALLLVFLLRVILWLNLLALLMALPSLAKTLSGFEGRLTRSPELLLNPTAMVALCVLAYIGLDPVVKACCVLRRFARQSKTSGLDLRLRLSVLQRVATSAIVGLALCIPAHLNAAEGSKAPAVSPGEMQRAIEDVFHDARNSWDLPVVENRRPASNPFVAFMDSVADRLDGVSKSIESAIDDAMKALQRIFSNRQRLTRANPQPVSRSAGWIVIGCFSLFLAAGVVVAFRNRRRRVRPQIATAILLETETADIAREDTSAQDRTGDEWLRLAAQYRANGDLRLALRALYLGTLAALGRNGFISLARGKSNLDYFRELERRARRLDGEFVPAFRANVRLFEESWYGAHPVTEEKLDLFEERSSRLRLV